MPLRGTGHSDLVVDDAQFFRNLAELHKWATTPTRKLSGVLEYIPRAESESTDSSVGKLLVCHDYKGGYTERPSGLCYTFNFWSYCDTFVYFSHHRVTVPPSGWITAAHRQGVKMLGTLIFEGDGEEDCLRLLVGEPPLQKSSSITSLTSFPLTRHYARLLAELAHQRGFDGYLLNFECSLRGGMEQVRLLTAWIMIFRDELRQHVGPHALAVWYDSVILNGQLRWQDRLNSYNLPFFLSSDTLFTNYTWPANYPSLTAQYFLSLDPALIGGDSQSATTSKTLQHVYFGVDVWGRGSHGGGGFGSYKAIQHIDPKFLGLSVALFGQAWTWESEQDKPGWSWRTWWEYERKLWIGPEDADEVVPVPQPKRPNEPDCKHGSFEPMSSFFRNLPPPDPAQLAFYTSFCPGVGRAWFVNGIKVLQTVDGWTDIDKQYSLGDLAWPRPALSWEGEERADKLPKSSTSLDLEDAWNGGSSLRLSIHKPASDTDDVFFDCVWIPVQSLSMTGGQSYTASIIYKLQLQSEVDVDLGLSVKLPPGGEETVSITPVPGSQNDLGGGWAEQSIQFVIPNTNGSSRSLSSIGLVVGFTSENASRPCYFSILLGQLTVYPSALRSPESVGNAQMLWTKFERAEGRSEFTSLSGTLTWEVTASFPPLPSIRVSSPEDPIPAWTLEGFKHWSRPFLYFIVYILVHPSESRGDPAVLDPAHAVFIGTTGLDGRSNRMYIDPRMIPLGMDINVGSRVRFYVRGVTERGEVLPWNRCSYVDVVS